MEPNETNEFSLKIASASDREALAVVLFRNGYTVRNVKRKSAKGTGYDYYIAIKEGP